MTSIAARAFFDRIDSKNRSRSLFCRTSYPKSGVHFIGKCSGVRQAFSDIYTPPAPRGEWADRVVTLLFSARGRISRKMFRRARLGFVLAYGALYLMIFQLRHDTQARIAHAASAPGVAYVLAELAVLLLAFGLVFWCGVVVTVKRWHDLDRSGLWALLGFVPLVGWIGQTVMCSFSDGTRGANRYGPAPR